ncbi:unnamed protein product [Acanthoscelides obtectus]|uniref:Uncharacterized protein n=1 Tax=Acanthoscelides obtectus TaxID=200917 RepID=A0A9P0JKQ2_ACAOB|nr:unnamed protein product [Acanthoscelides obtectus]CAK1658051.1 hypothetical protein AOBTE_LOCUS20672 [Acanthoscelides obtectus]
MTKRIPRMKDRYSNRTGTSVRFSFGIQLELKHIAVALVTILLKLFGLSSSR